MQTTESTIDPKYLWDLYFNDPSLENKNALLLHYLYLVKKIVLRMVPVCRHRSDYDDLISNGVLGLMDAINKFNTLKNVEFVIYAKIRIRGEVLDYMRRQDWISNSMRGKIKKVRKAFDDLAVQLGREADADDVAEHLGCDVRQVTTILDNEYVHNIVYFESVLSNYTQDENFKLIDTVRDKTDEADPEKQAEKEDVRNVLKMALMTLTEKEKIVIDLYYNKELLLKEIAVVLGVTESRVSQIHSKAIKKLQAVMEQQFSE